VDAAPTVRGCMCPPQDAVDEAIRHAQVLD